MTFSDAKVKACVYNSQKSVNGEEKKNMLTFRQPAARRCKASCIFLNIGDYF
jgi:hypothetical protein